MASTSSGGAPLSRLACSHAPGGPLVSARMVSSRSRRITGGSIGGKGRCDAAATLRSVSELRPHEILLVGDDEGIRGATAESLRRDGFEVRMEGSGPDGLAAFRDREPSLAILDVMLPGLGGV